MNDRLKDGLAQLYGPLGRSHDHLREKLIAALPPAVPGLRPNYWRRARYRQSQYRTELLSINLPFKLIRLSQLAVIQTSNAAIPALTNSLQ